MINNLSVDSVLLRGCFFVLAVAVTASGVVDCYSPIARGGRSNIFRLPQVTSTASPANSAVEPLPVQTSYGFQLSPPRIPQLNPGVGVQANVGGSRDDFYYYHSNGYASSSAERLSIGARRRDGRGNDGSYNDPNGSNGGRYGGIQIRGTPNEVRQDVPPTSPGLFSKGVWMPSPPSLQQQQAYYEQQYINGNQRIEIKQTGSNIRGSSLPPSSDVPPSSPALFSRGVLMPTPPSSTSYYNNYHRPQQERISIKETGHDVTAVKRAYVPLRNQVPQQNTDPFNEYYQKLRNNKFHSGVDDGAQRQRHYSSSLRQQQSYFPSPTSSLSSNRNGAMSSLYDMSPASDNSHEFAFDQQPQMYQSYQQSSFPSSNRSAKQLYNQLQDSWNKQIQRFLDASHLYIQASVWLHNAGFAGMSSYAVTRSNTLRNSALQLIDLGYEASAQLSQFGSPMGGEGDLKIKVPRALSSGSLSSSSPNTQFTNGFQRKKSFKDIVDVWQQLVSSERDLTTSQQQLESKMMTISDADGNAAYLVSPTFVSCAEAISDGQIRLEQGMACIADYVNQVQDDVALLKQYDGQFIFASSA